MTQHYSKEKKPADSKQGLRVPRKASRYSRADSLSLLQTIADPGSAAPGTILQLQRMYGNQVVGRMLTTIEPEMVSRDVLLPGGSSKPGIKPSPSARVLPVGDQELPQGQGNKERVCLNRKLPNEIPIGRKFNGGAAIQLKPTQTAKNDLQWLNERNKRIGLHERNQQLVYNLINNGPTPVQTPRQVPGVPANREELLANTIEFLRKRMVVIVVLTPTLSTQWYPPDKTIPPAAEQGNLFFDEQQCYPLLSVQKPEAAEGLNASDPNVWTRTGGESAHADTERMPFTLRLFMDKNYTEEQLKTILIHEVQHMADRHEPGQQVTFSEESIIDVNKEYGDVANLYKSEFRAYWLGDKSGNQDFGDSSRPAQNNHSVVYGTLLSFLRYVNTNFKNQRQENIFWYMVNRNVYPWLKNNYYFLPAFKKMVDDFARPTGGNLLNSERIEGLCMELSYLKAALIQMEKSLKKQPVDPEDELGFRLEKDILYEKYQTLKSNEVKNLNQLDKQFLGSPMSAPFWKFYHQCFEITIPVHRLHFMKEHIRFLLESAIKK